MEARDWSLVFAGFAVLAEIEGMKAMNQYRIECGNQIAYGEEAFFEKADELRDIAIAIGIP